MWLATEVTATAGVMPTKINSGRPQEAAADPEHAGHEPDRRAHRQDEDDIDRNVGDREVELHARLLLWFSRKRRPGGRSGHGLLLYLPAVEAGLCMHLCGRRAGSRVFA